MAASPATAARQGAGAGRGATLAAVLRARDVVLTLTVAGLKSRFGRGRLSAVKWLLDPFVLVGVYLIFVALLVGRPGVAPGLSLACAVVPFQIVFMSLSTALTAVRDQRSIVLNMDFPRSLIPVATAFTEAAGFGASLALIAFMMAVYGVAVTPAVLWLPVLLLVTMLLSVAIAYVATLFGIWFPELQSFARSFARASYFVAPGLVALSAIHGRANELVRINPLTGIFEAYRDAFLYGQAPAAWELLIPLAWALALLAVLLPIYRREEPHLAKVV